MSKEGKQNFAIFHNLAGKFHVCPSAPSTGNSKAPTTSPWKLWIFWRKSFPSVIGRVPSKWINFIWILWKALNAFLHVMQLFRELMKLIRTQGKILASALPQEVVTANITRRIIKLIREEYDLLQAKVSLGAQLPVLFEWRRDRSLDQNQRNNFSQNRSTLGVPWDFNCCSGEFLFLSDVPVKKGIRFLCSHDLIADWGIIIDAATVRWLTITCPLFRDVVR